MASRPLSQPTSSPSNLFLSPEKSKPAKKNNSSKKKHKFNVYSHKTSLSQDAYSYNDDCDDVFSLPQDTSTNTVAIYLLVILVYKVVFFIGIKLTK